MTKTLLAVLAHPDDESFGLGGTLALYASKGYDTYYVCATRGEAGTVDEVHLKGFKDTAEMRTAELLRAAKELGLKEVFFLGYRDSGMPGMEANQHPDAQIKHPIDEVAGRVVKYIRELKPDVVITFDPVGGYKHPDHIHIHQATVLAFTNADDGSFHPEAGDPFMPQALYFQVFPRSFLKWLTRLMPLFGKDPTKFGRNGDINLKELAEVDFPVHVRLDIRSVADVKRKAGAQHASQGGVQMRRGLMGFIIKVFGEKEDYMRAYPPIVGSFKMTHDLFDDV
ncbi:MAG: PIG-L deacetylase family protein [Anaerolineales bacterium]|nr:PIG-L deacetylase family protein [Anaerolineales bacterium]